MNANHLRVKFIGNPDTMNEFDLIPCQLIMQEVEQKVEPVVSTLRWIRGEMLQPFFEVGDEYGTYDINTLIHLIPKSDKGGAAPILTIDQVREIRDGYVSQGEPRRRTVEFTAFVRHQARHYRASEKTIYKVLRNDYRPVKLED
jgi:hypothetical protein